MYYLSRSRQRETWLFSCYYVDFVSDNLDMCTQSRRIGLTQDREQTETDSKHKVPTLRAETWRKSQNASTPCFFLYFKHFHLSFIFNSVTFGHLYYESATFCLRGNPKEIYQVRQIFLILTKVLHTNTERGKFGQDTEDCR